MDIENDAYRYAIKNAFLHNGKAELKAVMGKIKALDDKIDLKKIIPKLQEIVNEVNGMSFKQIEEEYRKEEAKQKDKAEEKEAKAQEETEETIVEGEDEDYRVKQLRRIP